jgi:hypothetical protein
MEETPVSEPSSDSSAGEASEQAPRPLAEAHLLAEAPAKRGRGYAAHGDPGDRRTCPEGIAQMFGGKAEGC